jgi:hypothetical protein
MHEIGRAYGKPHNGIRCVLLSRGAIALAARQRADRAISLAEREIFREESLPAHPYAR